MPEKQTGPSARRSVTRERHSDTCYGVDAVLSETGQSRKDKHRMAPLTCAPFRSRIHRDRSRMGVARGWGRGAFTGTEFLFHKARKVLTMGAGDGHTPIGVYSVSQIYTLKTIRRANFMLCAFAYSFKKFILLSAGNGVCSHQPGGISPIIPEAWSGVEPSPGLLHRREIE